MKWRSTGKQRASRAILLGQGAFLLATGLWPIFHLRSFEAVTGPKVDDWLVKSIGALLAVIGGSLALGSLEGKASPALRMLGIGSAIALGSADVIYVVKGRISRVYLLDSVAQTAILLGWVVEGSRFCAASNEIRR